MLVCTFTSRVVHHTRKSRVVQCHLFVARSWKLSNKLEAEPAQERNRENKTNVALLDTIQTATTPAQFIASVAASCLQVFIAAHLNCQSQNSQLRRNRLLERSSQLQGHSFAHSTPRFLELEPATWRRTRRRTGRRTGRRRRTGLVPLLAWWASWLCSSESFSNARSISVGRICPQIEWHNTQRLKAAT